MIFSTTDDFTILDYSKSVLQYLSMALSEWKNHKENTGNEISMSTLIISFEDIMQE